MRAFWGKTLSTKHKVKQLVLFKTNNMEEEKVTKAQMLTASVAPEEFDWDAFECGSDI